MQLTQAAFWEFVHVLPNPKQTVGTFWFDRVHDGCWMWTGSRDGKGYGRWGGVGAHRVADEYARGPIPEGMVIDHLCANSLCVNPLHMEVVTKGENTRRRRRGRNIPTEWMAARR